MIEGVIFDLDGTLIRLPINYDRLRRRLAACFQLKETPVHIFDTVRRLILQRPNLQPHLWALLDEEEVTAASSFQEVDGARDVVRRLVEEGVRTALVTLQGRRAVGIILKELSLDQAFTIRVMREYSLDRVEQITRALKELKTSRSRTVMVGDRWYDVESAREVGCPSILIRPSPVDAKGDVRIVDSLKEAGRLLSSMM